MCIAAIQLRDFHLRWSGPLRDRFCRPSASEQVPLRPPFLKPSLNARFFYVYCCDSTAGLSPALVIFYFVKSSLVVRSHSEQLSTCMPKPKKWTAADFEVKASSIEGAGQGLFTKVRLEPEDTIGYYTGEVISSEEFHHPDRPFSAYVLWVCHSHIIVGEGPKANYTRFINHSDQPNASLTVSSRWKSARFEALRTIEPGEEIFFDYGDDYWEKEELLTED